MVLVESDFVDIDRVTFLEPPQCLKHELLCGLVQKCFPVLYGDLDVVVALGDIVVPIPHSILRFYVWRARHARALYSGHSSLRRAQGVLAGIL